MIFFHSRNLLFVLRNFISSFALLFVFEFSFSQNPDQPALPYDSVETDNVRYLASPTLSYSPETRLGIGVAGVVYFRLQHHHDPVIHNKVSNATGMFVYTLNKQIITSVSADLYLNNNADYFYHDFTYYRYPNSFWGIGNHTLNENEERYTASYFIWKGNYQRKIYKSFYAGAQFRLKRHKMIETKDGGLLDAGNIFGTEQSFISGLGMILKYDHRDNDYSTNKGSLIQFSWLHYDKFFGSDLLINEFRFDLRRFFPLGKNHVLGLQMIYKMNLGVVPFHQLASFGGQNIMRGYYEGRFRDHYSLAAQTEYRFPIWKRLGGAAFISTGSVADEINHFNLSGFRVAGGAGLRYKIFKLQDIRLRLDAAITQDGDFAWYAFFSEAF